MMGGLVQTDRVVEALEMFRLMCRKGIGIDSVSLSCILGDCARGVCGDFGQDDLNAVLSYNVHGQQVHGLTIKLDMHINKPDGIVRPGIAKDEERAINAPIISKTVIVRMKQSDSSKGSISAH